MRTLFFCQGHARVHVSYLLNLTCRPHPQLPGASGVELLREEKRVQRKGKLTAP